MARRTELSMAVSPPDGMIENCCLELTLILGQNVKPVLQYSLMRGAPGHKRHFWIIYITQTTCNLIYSSFDLRVLFSLSASIYF